MRRRFCRRSRHGRTWLLPLAVLLVAGAALRAPGLGRRARANGLVAIGVTGFVYIFVQGFAIGSAGWAFETLARAFGPLAEGQSGMGLGACLVASAFAMILSLGLADRGFFRGDAFVAGAFVAVGMLVAVFTFFPVVKILIQALQDSDGAFSSSAFAARLTTEKIWGLACIAGTRRCGVAWNTLLLATACAIACTALGLAFALVVTRTNFRFKKFLRVLSVLPIITPPFVVGTGAHPALWPIRTRQPAAGVDLGHHANAVALWPAGRACRARSSHSRPSPSWC